MVSASELLDAKVPFSGDSINPGNIGKYVTGTIMILGAVKAGAFLLNKGQNQLGISQSDTQIRTV